MRELFIAGVVGVIAVIHDVEQLLAPNAAEAIHAHLATAQAQAERHEPQDNAEATLCSVEALLLRGGIKLRTVDTALRPGQEGKRIVGRVVDHGGILCPLLHLGTVAEDTPRHAQRIEGVHRRLARLRSHLVDVVRVALAHGVVQVDGGHHHGEAKDNAATAQEGREEIAAAETAQHFVVSVFRAEITASWDQESEQKVRHDGRHVLKSEHVFSVQGTEAGYILKNGKPRREASQEYDLFRQVAIA
mmetsp:Transcript_123433/g.348761  ORF Transcript_123433/g.348761 Transcript_123433/m.348761 type:complete len:246 (-) Transcript_123433:94-831(-)